MKIYTNTLLIILISIISMITIIAPAASQMPDVPEGVPDLPMALYGDIQLEGGPAPVDTIIAAYTGDTLLGYTTVESAGQYGTTPLNLLVVNEPTGDEVKFLIQSPSMTSAVEAEQTLAINDWQSGGSMKLDLSRIGSQEGSIPEKDLTKIVGGHGSILITTTDTTSNEEGVAEAGGSGDDSGLELEDTSEISGDSTGGTTNGAGTSMLTAAIIGVFALILLIFIISKNKNF